MRHHLARRGRRPRPGPAARRAAWTRTKSLPALTASVCSSQSGSTRAADEQPLVHEPELPEPVPAPVVRQQRPRGRGTRAGTGRRSCPSAAATAACAGRGRGARPPGHDEGTNCAALAPVPMTATRCPASSTVSSQAAEWKDGPAKRSRPAMAGKDGRLSCPTAQTTASNTSVGRRYGAVGRRTVSDHCCVAGRSVEAGLGHLGRGSGCRSASSELLRPVACRYASRSGWAEKRDDPVVRSGRTRSCRAGWGRRPGSRGRRSRARCRPLRRSSRRRSLRRPAWRSRYAAARPEAPAPMTAQRKARSWSRSSRCQLGAPRVGAGQRELLGQERPPSARWPSPPTRKPKIAAPFPVAEVVVGPAGGEVRDERCCGERARLVLLFGSEAPPGHEELGLVRREVVAQERQVAGALGHGAQQRMHLCRGDRRLASGRPFARPCPTHGPKPT